VLIPAEAPKVELKRVRTHAALTPIKKKKLKILKQEDE
jgi:hypothetical protein